METVVLQLCYNGFWEQLPDGRMDYKHGRNRAFIVRKECTFDEFISRVYEVLKLNPNEYDMVLRTMLRSSCSVSTCLLPMDILDDEMVNVVLRMASEIMNYGSIPIFVTTSPKTPHFEVPVPLESRDLLYNQRRFSPIGLNNDPSPDTENTSSYNTSAYYDRDYDEFNDGNVGNFDNEDNREADACANIDISFGDREDVDEEGLQDEGEDGYDAGEPNYVGSSSSRSIAVDPLTSLAPLIPSDMSGPNFVGSSSSGSIFIGQMFIQKSDMIIELRKVSFRNKFEFRIARSTTTRFEAHCATSSCKWRFRATKFTQNEHVCWVVRRYDNEHTCNNVEVLPSSMHRSRSRVVGHIIKDKFIQEKRIYTPNDIVADIQQEHTVHLSYHQAYRAREVALSLIRGSPKESYNLLPKYSYVLKEGNEGTVTAIQLDTENNFLYYFVSIGSCIKGFLQYIRPVIAVDGTHLKGQYRGTLFVATCLDGNNQLYPLAIGIGDSENNAAWEWFMTKLHGAIGDVPELVFISDRCSAIERAVMKCFAHAGHGVCFYHVKGNVKAKFKMSRALWDQFEPAFIQAAKSYCEEEFRTQLEGLWGLHHNAANYLENNVGICNWARSQFEGRRYSILTTNIAESVNSLLREPRKFPITHLIDHFRKTLQQWFYDRLIVAESMSSRLTKWAYDIVSDRKSVAERMTVRPISRNEFQVFGGGMKEGLVDISQKTCSCRVFQLDQLVCAHAIAACLAVRVDYIDLCSHYYFKDSLVGAYSEPIRPVGDVTSWNVPESIQQLQVNPPIQVQPSGRRRVLKIPSQGEEVTGRTVICGRCHEPGHNRKRCKNPIGSGEN